MHFRFIMAMLFVISGNCAVAGDVTQAVAKLKASLLEKCNSSVCVRNIKAKGSNSFELSISSAEAAAFGPTTQMEINGVADAEFTLADDPGYAPGDTSARIVQTKPYGDGVHQTTTQINWGDGMLKISQSVSAKGTFSEAHPPSPVPAEMIAKLVKGDAKDHNVLSASFLVKASNSGIPFLEASGTLYGDVREATIETSRFSGENIEVVNLTFNSKAFVSGP